MEQINNNNVIEECSSLLGYPVEKKPDLDTSKILLVADINPKILRRSTILGWNTSAITGSMTVVSNPPITKRMFITGISAAIVKDVACDRVSGSISVYIQPKGKAASTPILEFPVITLTAQQMNQNINFSSPIEIEPGTGVSMNGAFTAGVLVRSCVVYGYLIDNISNS